MTGIRALPSRRLLACLTLLIGCALVATPAHAEQFMSPMARADWQVERSPIRCRLRQTLPRYGEAVFETLAGGAQSFFLHTTQNPLLEGPTRLIASPPLWNPTRAAIELGAVDIGSGVEPLRLAGSASQPLLDSLNDGLAPQFSRPLQARPDELGLLRLSPLNFRPAYRDYQDCIQHLLPLSYEQIAITAVTFLDGSTELTASAQQKIDALLRYVQADRSITGFGLFAVSADTPRRLENLRLSKERAQQVHEYLMSRGIAAAKISSDYGDGRGGKAGARSVTIRLRRAQQ